MIRFAPLGPFQPWASLAARLLETSFSAGVVIASRTTRMILATSPPDPADRAEFRRMVEEKAPAFGKAAAAMWQEAFFAQQRLAFLAWSQWMLLPRAAAATRLARTTVPGKALATEMSNATARIAHRGITPIRAAASRNAKRLARGRRRRR